VTLEITVDKRNGILRVHEEFARVDRTSVDVVYSVHLDTDLKVKQVSAVTSDRTTWRQRGILIKRVTRAVNAWVRENEAAVIGIVVKEVKQQRDAANSYVASVEARLADTQAHLEGSRQRAAYTSAALAKLRKRQRELQRA